MAVVLTSLTSREAYKKIRRGIHQPGGRSQPKGRLSNIDVERNQDPNRTRVVELHEAPRKIKNQVLVKALLMPRNCCVLPLRLSHSTLKGPIECVPIRPYPRVYKILRTRRAQCLGRFVLFSAKELSDLQSRAKGPAYHEAGVQDVLPSNTGRR